MSVVRRNNRCTLVQREYLVQFMRSHPDLALNSNKTNIGQQRLEQLWDQLKSELNEIGPSKTIHQWRITWRDLKSRARLAKYASLKRAQRKKSNNLVLLLSSMDESIMSVLGKTSSEGLPISESELGVREPEVATLSSDPLGPEMEIEDVKPRPSSTSTSGSSTPEESLGSAVEKASNNLEGVLTAHNMVKAVAVVTVSDTCFKDNSQDKSGPALADVAKEMFPEANLHTIIIPDEKEIIERELKYFCDANIDLVLTTGGTGLSYRDVTPEATKAVIHREVPGIAVALTMEGLKKTPMAMLSRLVAGVRDTTLIINFPGSKKAVLECVEVVKPVLAHAIALIKDDLHDVKTIHDSMQFGHVCPHTRIGSSVDVTKVAFRPRESPYPMLEMENALKLVDEVMKQWTERMEIVSIEEGLGKVVAQTLYAKEPMPPFLASMKDGYACIASDGVGIRRVRSALTAGEAPTMPLSSGECARVNTGAALPVGADAVLQVEDTTLISASEDGSIELEVEFKKAVKPQQDVRPVGFDIPLGAVLVDKGDVLDAAQIGVLAGAGYQNVTIKANPKIALLSTGNELQEPSELKLRPAHIRDSNRTMLKVLLREYGYESIDCGIARDEPVQLANAIHNALRNCDVLVCTGGVSMGERDLLKPVLLNDFGATLHFGRVRMKPGKPTTFATCQFEGKTKFIFALPGNPVSAYVCCVLFVVRALRACSRRPPRWARMRVRLSHAATLDPRPEYARATLAFPATDDLPSAAVLGTQCSSRLLSACGASVLLELPGATETCKRLPAGSVVSALIIGRIEPSK